MIADDDALLLLNAYIDGELSPGEALAMERRLAAEPDLRAEAERLTRLSGDLGEMMARVPVSPTLRGRVVAAIGFADEAPPRRWHHLRQPLAAALLAGFVAGGLMGGGTVYWGRGPGLQDSGEAALAAHLRSLAAPQPFDIASSDRHVVKPWFNGRTTVAPAAPDFADKGFPLAGGRIDIVQGEPVPTLVYRRDLHVISVTAAPKVSGMAGETRRGGTMIERWDAGDLSYWAVSDLNTKDLRTFVELFRASLTQQK